MQKIGKERKVKSEEKWKNKRRKNGRIEKTSYGVKYQAAEEAAMPDKKNVKEG